MNQYQEQKLIERTAHLEKELAEKNRELEIEAALQKVGVRTMAMQNSDELAEIISIVFKQLIELGIKQTQMRTCAIVTLKQHEPIGECWITNSEGNIITQSFMVPYNEGSAYKPIYDAWKNDEKFFVVHLAGKALLKHLNYLKTHAKIPTQRFQALPDQPTETYTHALFFSQGYLLIISNEPLVEYHEIFKRFGAVFQQTYTRFLDLQKAEGQAKEAQIEAALEKVRSRSLAVHTTDEFTEVIKIVFERLQELEIPMTSASINVVIKDSKDTEAYICGSGENGLTLTHIRLVHFDHPIANDRYHAYEEGLDFFTKTYSSKEKNSFYEYEFLVSDLKYIPADIKKMVMESQHYTCSVAFTKNSMIVINDFEGKSLSPKEIDIVKRFSRVFEQAYIRFLDLQKAEVQAREAKIEASLERVRSKAMAMQKSVDLSQAVAIVFEELDKLNLEMLRCGIGILDKEKCSADIWTTTKSESETVVQVAGDEPMSIHPLLQGAFNAWVQNNEDFSYTLEGKDMEQFYKAIAGTNFKFPDSQSIISGTENLRQFYYVTTFLSGGLYAFRDTPFPDEAKIVMKRFADVFNLTYTRFLDIQKAEAQAKEAIKASSLDRVRGEIASMRNTADLDRITPLIWKELTTLGISFIRCGVFIMDEQQNAVHSYLSTPDGLAIAAFHTPLDAPGNLAGSIDNWRNQKIYVTHWAEKDFSIQADVLVQRGAITSREQYLNAIPREGFHLHFLPFRQGMLYVGSVEPLKRDDLQLVQVLADAFSVAYARYEDFTRLEAAKQQVERTLIDLKQAQQQLVQSEKMASLGELTAGIAHEIQNPLNFVNNFSEINKELIEELKSEKSKLKINEIDNLLDNIAANEEKINHHGKRADAIVKGMLQHSRTSTGVKEFTDINALADEYLRLSYHGLRAKDKSFIADFKTEFYESIGKINIMPQDIGRVLLNLFNNAFYAVNEKQKTAAESYQPLVMVQTKKINDKVEVKVSDNGNGIPQKIVEKIFQPFFTTKPTGQGTGLGLSLSYDIIKAHGGEIKVETKEGEGTAFMIQLPA